MTHAILHPERCCDRDAVDALLQAALVETLPWPASVLPSMLALRAAGQLSVALVATVHGRIAGYIAFTPVSADTSQEQWHLLQALVVSPAVRQIGIGSALLRSACNALANQGAVGCLVLDGTSWFSAQGFQPYRESTAENADQVEGERPRLLARTLSKSAVLPATRLQLPWARVPCSSMMAFMH